MKLILAVDALVPPLTGIGRYAWELACHYQALRSEVDSLRFFHVNRWISDPADLLRSRDAHVVEQTRRGSRVRPPASWRRWQLQREMRGHVFHSPNYFLPESVSTGIVTVHDLSVFRYPELHPAARIQQFEKGFESTLSRACHLITDSEAIRREVIEYFGWSPTCITAIPLGVRSEFRPRTAHESADALCAHGLLHGQYSLCVSTLEPRKRVDRLLAAYLDLSPALRARYPLVLVGSAGWLSDDLHEQIAEGERAGWLRYLGFVEEALLPVLYSGARAFLFPSVYEGFGLPVLEAMASGVPTLTSNRSSLPEVTDGASWLIEPDDHDALRDAIEEVLCDEAWRSAASVRGLRIASASSWAKCAQTTLDLCKRFA
ncbi:glycosyltransferase family 4 protein [Paraburkholderia hospita]|uniref:glycosyltransferase family 4 protein n=1 Tax=Paraburkholderia hospita TaxID=169430 RepID=UPI0002719399|nr:glycosyltransferase family 1 protein [Paraburkholderia hospita]EUC14746.1 glycosyl transferase group 1 [Burkholderia sp. BT03]SKC94000.1 alpha-1,3-rhamnosyl/mannosyltransferase [Paraburkholderia hospita]